MTPTVDPSGTPEMNRAGVPDGLRRFAHLLFSVALILIATSGTLALARSATTVSNTYYVATNGKDSFSGTLATPNSRGTDGPFATLAKAQQAVQSAKKSISGPITVEIRGGTYYLSAPLSFTSADSGTSSQEITWEGYPGDSMPVISAGQPLTGWTHVSGNKWTVKVPSSFSNFEGLYYNGERRYRPTTTASSGKYLYLNPVVVPSSQTNCTTAYSGGFRCTDRFSFTPGDLASTYHQITDVEIVSFELWTVSRMRLSSVDTVNNIAYLTGPALGGTNFGFFAGHRYLVDNVKESLSLPGQWYVDRGTTPWTLTYLANTGENPNQDTVIVPQQPQILAATSLQYITFKNLQFSHDNYTIAAAGHKGNSGETQTPAAISLNSSSNVTFSGVTIAHTLQFGIEFIGTAVAGQGNTLTASLLYDLGAGGVRLGQVAAKADTDATVAQYNTVSDNMIFGGGRFLPGGVNPAIWAGSSHHNTISHNDIHDFYSGAINLGLAPNGSLTYTHDNLVEYNLLYDLGQGVTDDMGCVHLASSNNTGNQVLNNICHDVTHDPGSAGYGGNGIYVDQNSQNVTVKNNLVYRVSDTALVFNGGAVNTTVSNNIFAYAAKALLHRGQNSVANSFNASHNIFYFDRGTIENNFGDWFCSPSCTSQFVLGSNVYWITTGAAPQFITTDSSGRTLNKYNLSQWQSTAGEDKQSLNSNPAFTNAAYPADSYSLMPNSPALGTGIGFVEPAFDQAGPTESLVVPPNPVPQAYPLQLLNPATDF
jgi:Right handed beta helix region